MYIFQDYIDYAYQWSFTVRSYYRCNSINRHHISYEETKQSLNWHANAATKCHSTFTMQCNFKLPFLSNLDLIKNKLNSSLESTKNCPLNREFSVITSNLGQTNKFLSTRGFPNVIKNTKPLKL